MGSEMCIRDRPEGFLFLVGPRQLQGLFDHYKLDALYNDPVFNMPFFRQHLKMCPENQVNPDLVVFLAQKKGEEKKADPLTTTEEEFDGTIPQMRGFQR